MSNFPNFEINMVPSTQLEQILEALITSAEINHWPANTEMLHWLARWIRELQARDGDETFAARTAILSDRLLKFYMAGQGKKKRKSRRKVSLPSTVSKSEALTCLMERPEGASRREMCALAGWSSIYIPTYATRRPDKKVRVWTGEDGLNRYRLVPKEQATTQDLFEEDDGSVGEGEDVFESEEESEAA